MENPFDTINERFDKLENQYRSLADLIRSNSKEDSEELLTVQDASKLLNLSIPTIYTKVSKAELPVMKMKRSKRLYFSKTDLLEYLKEGKRKTVSEIEAEADQYLVKPKKG